MVEINRIIDLTTNNFGRVNFEEAEILRKAGYFVCPKFLEPQPFPVILRTFNKQVKELGIYNFKNWFFTMGDYDAI